MAALLLAGCDKPAPQAPQSGPDTKLTSVKDIESPKAEEPVIDAASYERGYDAGMDAGEKAARKEPPRAKVPTMEETTVLALEAAGSDATRAERWQRGYASGYREGFARIATGKK
jgi:hypothetical protein